MSNNLFNNLNNNQSNNQLNSNINLLNKNDLFNNTDLFDNNLIPNINQNYITSYESPILKYNNMNSNTSNNIPSNNIPSNNIPSNNIYNSQKFYFDKLNSIQLELDNYKANNDIGCVIKVNELTNKINNLQIESNNSINNYINLLSDLLIKNQIITQYEVDNIKLKIQSGIVDLNTAINYLEDKKKFAKTLTMNYNFDEIYLNKWNVPLPRPPVCIPEVPVIIKQNDTNLSNFHLF